MSTDGPDETWVSGKKLLCERILQALLIYAICHVEKPFFGKAIMLTCHKVNQLLERNLAVMVFIHGFELVV